MKRYLTSALALAAVLGATHATAADPGAGRLLASQCAQCHGTNGGGLAGESASDIYGDLREMKSKTKPGSIMHQQAKGYTDEEMRLIADYLSTL